MQIALERQALETHHFRYCKGFARRSAALPLIILYAILVWQLFGTDILPGWVAAAIITVTATIALVWIVLSRHPATRLSVGPDGFAFPVGLTRRIGWSEINRITYSSRPSVVHSRDWLVIEIKDDAPARYTLPFLPHAITALPQSRAVRVPLHALASSSGDVLASVERFMPVIDLTLAEPLTTPPLRS